MCRSQENIDFDDEDEEDYRGNGPVLSSSPNQQRSTVQRESMSVFSAYPPSKQRPEPPRGDVPPYSSPNQQRYGPPRGDFPAYPSPVQKYRGPPEYPTPYEHPGLSRGNFPDYPSPIQRHGLPRTNIPAYPGPSSVISAPPVPY